MFVRVQKHNIHGTAGHAAENESNAIKFRRRMRPEFLRLKPQPIKSSHAELK